MFRINTVSASFVLGFISMANLGLAKEQQSWSVQFENETAIISATSKTPTKFIQATIEALKAEGIEKFALKALKPADLKQQDTVMIVKVVENDAELLIAPDLAHKYVISTIKHLNEVGINEVKLTLFELEEETKSD